MVLDNETIKILRQNYNFEFDLWGYGRWIGFHNGICITRKNDEQVIIDTNGKTFVFSKNIQILERAKHLIFKNKKNKYGLINIEGAIINYPVYDEYWKIPDFVKNANNAYFCVELKTYGKGVVDIDGKIMIDCQYRKVLENVNNLFIVENMKRKYGIVDICNKRIIPFNYLNLFILSNKLFTAKASNKLWGLYDYENNTIISPQYQSLYFYEEYGVAKLKNKWGIIDKNNNSVTGFIFDDLFIDVFTQHYRDNKGNYRDRQGNISYPTYCNNTKNIYVKKNDIWYEYSLFTGKSTSSTYYDLPINTCITRKRELNPICVNNLWGFANIDGEIVIPAIFDKVRAFKYDRALCCINDKWGIIDKTGKQLSYHTAIT